MYQTVSSRDGTPIAVRRSGYGPPLVLVHGTTGSDYSWNLVAPHLEPHYSLHIVQRRGRGQSGDGDDYSLELEGADVAAVVDSIGEPVYLFGHSYGAACSLEASLLTSNIGKLVLYEPPVEYPYPEGSIERQEELLAAGRREDAIVEAIGDALLPEELEALRAAPTWPDRVALAPTVPRESRADSAYRVEAERFRAMTVPTLLLLGEETSDAFRTAAEKVRTALPNCRVVVLPGQGHAATMTAPELLANEVIGFLGKD